MNNIYTIKIHSFVDLITNSSTEIYIQASEKTVKAIKKLVDDILAAGGSTLTCADLFTVTIDKKRLLEDCGYEDETDDNGEKYTPETFYKKKAEESDYDGPSCSIYIKVVAKEGTDAAKAAARVLSNLTGLFSIQEGCN